MTFCKECVHYTPETHSHGTCAIVKWQVCGVVKPCLDAKERKGCKATKRSIKR